MSVISDKLKKSIEKVLNTPTNAIKSTVDEIVKNTRLGKDQGDEIKNVLDTIAKVESSVETIQAGIKSLKAVQETLEVSKTAAEGVKKASAVAAALNPPAAAATIAQEFVITKIEKEVEDAKNTVNVAPTLVENFKKTMRELKDKLKKAQEKKKQKDSIREQRKNNLNS